MKKTFSKTLMQFLDLDILTPNSDFEEFELISYQCMISENVSSSSVIVFNLSKVQ